MTRFDASDTDKASGAWIAMDPKSYLSLISLIVQGSQFDHGLEFTKATDSGAVYVRNIWSVGPSERGSLFLELEEFSKASVDRV